MDSLADLHQAARRYCIERDQLVGPNWVFDELLQQVERFVPTDFKSLDEMREMLSAAAEMGVQNSLGHVLGGDPKQAKQELALFTDFLERGDITQWSYLPALPYRRVLTDAERRQVVDGLEARWGRWYAGFCDREQPDAVTIDMLETDVMEAPGSYDAVRHAVAQLMTGTYLFEIREWGPSYEQQLECCSFQCSEGCWTEPGYDWMVYCSHEASLTIAGAALIGSLHDLLSGVPLRPPR